MHWTQNNQHLALWKMYKMFIFLHFPFFGVILSVITCSFTLLKDISLNDNIQFANCDIPNLNYLMKITGIHWKYSASTRANTEYLMLSSSTSMSTYVSSGLSTSTSTEIRYSSTTSTRTKYSGPNPACSMQSNDRNKSIKPTKCLN